ncbi:MAG: hypothetical protein KDC98_23715 [Planctomycetes bacterium]|nr:hypothetical protein [Planctomycetota bacterium]
MRLHLASGIALFACITSVTAQTPVVTWSGENMRLRSASVTPSGGNAYAVTLTMENDNQNASLPSTYRRWWHCEIDSLAPGGTVLTVTVNNAGYTDVILPVWALSNDGGTTFSSYSRMPTSAVPTQPSGSSHRFTIATPAGVDAIRIAKYFPYTVTRKSALLQSLTGHPGVRSITSLGNSRQGRPIEMIELTDAAVADAGKRRIWIHAGIHPAETTSYFVVEGLIDWLGSNDPAAALLLDNAIVNIVPMANPDGVWLGNYRVNANSANLEDEWAAPYNSPQPEIIALRGAIEGFMGTTATPGSNPIDVVLNLHSSHNVSKPFHYQHTANPNWSATGNNSGVIPVVNSIEGDWIADFRAKSPFVAQGTTASSSAGAPSRPFVESMMHDRWSAIPQWTGAPNNQDPVMAITFEGTYGMGPTNGIWNTEADYELVGAQMGQALAEYLGLQPTSSATAYGTPCTAVTLYGSLTPVAGGNQATLAFTGAPGNGLGVIMLGLQQRATPLPAPLPACLIRQSMDAVTWVPVNPFGIGQYSMFLPNWPGLGVYTQAFAADLGQSPIFVDTSNGIELRNNF